MTSSHYPRYIFWLVLSFSVGFSFYYGLGFYGLANNNEGLYAEIAREMYLSHQYILPTLNGVPYVEKPPLLYWCVSGCFYLFGINEFATRFIPATAGILLCFALVFFSQQINRLREGAIAALILGTSLGFVLIARTVFFDMLLTTLFSGCLMSCYLAWFFAENENHIPKIFNSPLTPFKCIWYVRLAYIFLALAVLTKGILAIALVPFILGAFLLSTKTLRSRGIIFLDPIAILIFFSITAPWHILATLKHPGFLQHFFINEQFLRFLDKRIPQDYYTGPFYYYLPRIPLYMLPWGLLLPLLGFKKYRKNTFKDPLALFAWLWFLIPLIFFSLSKAKANYYMVISCPALALLIARAINMDFSKQIRVKIWLFIMGGFVIFSLTFIGFGAHIAKKHEDQFSAKNLGLLLRSQPQTTKEKPIFIYQEFETISSLAFYLQQPVKIIDSLSKDLWYGSKFAPKDRFLTPQKFDQDFRNKTCYVVLRKNELPIFHKRTPNCKFYPTIASDGWVVLSHQQEKTHP
jgi:4-amino-4-deoxy-L-arabinose transferase-like glycosyltransferase